MESVELLGWKQDQHEAVRDLMLAQQSRRRDLDSRLPGFELDTQLESICQELADPHTLVAVGAAGMLLGVGLPAVTSYMDDAEMRTYWPDRMGTAPLLAIRNGSSDCLCALRSIIDKAVYYWRNQQATGAGLIWPSRDVEIGHVLRSFGFNIDAYFALRSVEGLRRPRRVSRSMDVCVRSACPDDEDAVVALFLQVIASHIPYSPFARSIDGVEDAFRDRLSKLWRDADNCDARANGLILVAEVDGHIAGMADCLIATEEGTSRSLVPPGVYGYVNSFGVDQRLRSKGIGAILDSAVNSEFAKLGVKYSYLWFSTYNSSASRFWPMVGYEPLWTSYQSRFD